MKNCPNCGAVLEPYKCRCEYCGSWYFDLTAFDMTGDSPYYVKFKTDMGIITALAKPELQTIDITEDTIYAVDSFGNKMTSFIQSRNCDFGVIFHTQMSPIEKD